MNEQENIVLLVATNMLNKSATISTLEVKKECRRLFPKLTWNQSDVSQWMIDIHTTGQILCLQYKYTGVFREYYIDGLLDIPTNTFPVGVINPANAAIIKDNQNKAVKLSRTKIVEKMMSSGGRFYTVTFVKKDGSTRVMNGRTFANNFLNTLGYINFIENKKGIHAVDPMKIKSVFINSQEYEVK